MESAFDSPTLTNVTFSYTGPVVTGPTVFSGFSILSTDSGVNLAGDFTSQSTINVGADSGATDQLSSSVPVPLARVTVPESSSWVLLATGLTLAAAGMCRRVRNA